ncbi:MAG: hypothetical protein AAF810_06180 [Cyanobacteria bacterium P01_D01_bin.36]
MATLTIEIPDDLMEQISPVKDQLPELIRRGLQPFALPAEVYRYVLDFVASQPTPEQISDFRPTAEMQGRLRHLLGKEKESSLSVDERQELDEYERIEHLIVMLKTGSIMSTGQARSL